MKNKTLPSSDKVRVKRGHQRGHYDRETVNTILDSGYLANIAYIFNSEPFVMPTLYWREDNFVYWHGSTASRAMKSMVGQKVCLTVSHLDGLVLAKSAFHHSANYRSAMLFGVGEQIHDDSVKSQSLKTYMERHFPGRWDILRPVNNQELKATLLLRMKIDEFSSKIRTGPPIEAREDQELPIWSGILSLEHSFSTIESADERAIPNNIKCHVGRSL